IRVLRRTDVTHARLMYPAEPNAVVLDIVHVDLYFFFDIDVIILVVELAGAALPLALAQNTLYRLGRAYPTHWGPDNNGGHRPTRGGGVPPLPPPFSRAWLQRRERGLPALGPPPGPPRVRPCGGTRR